jgi:hypothetical protein
MYVWSIIFRTRYEILCLCSTVDHDVCLIYYFQNEVWDTVSMFYSWPWCMSDLLFLEWGMRYCVYVLQLTMMYVWSIIFRMRYEILCLCSTVDHDVCLIYYFQNEVWDIVSMFYSWPWCMSDLLFSERGMRYCVYVHTLELWWPSEKDMIL